MKLCVAVITLTLAAVALAGQTCRGNGNTLKQFNGRKEETNMPCKFHAVRQVCGKYEVTVTPGNVYLHPHYRLDSIWLGIKDTKSGQFWEGRTDNKIAVKFFNGWTSLLFNKKGGNLDTSKLLKFDKSKTETSAEASNGDFLLTFRPWDPESKKFKRAKWSFECLSKKFPNTGYPEQICGGDDKQEVADRTENLGLESRDQTMYYDVFTNTGITQMNPKCINATQIMTKHCTEKQRRLAMITCTQILYSYPHTKCVTKYSCDPMDVFLDCLAWVCSDFQDDAACEGVAAGIDMCREFRRGDLSKKVDAANCYKDFLPIKH